MEHRHDGQHDIIGPHAHCILTHRHQRVQHVRAMRIQHALGVAGRARRIAKPACSIFREAAPCRIGRSAINPQIKRHRPQRIFWHRSGVGKDHKLLNRRQLILHRLNNWQESCIKHQNLVFGVIGNPRDLFRVQARIDRVQHSAHAHCAIPGRHVPRRVPAQRCHPVAQHNTIILQRGGHLLCQIIQLAIRRAHNVAFHPARHNLALRVNQLCVLKNFINRKRPVLHNALHGAFPFMCPAHR